MFKDIDVKKLIELLDASDIGILQLKTKDFEFLLARDGVTGIDFQSSLTESKKVVAEPTRSDSNSAKAVFEDSSTSTASSHDHITLVSEAEQNDEKIEMDSSKGLVTVNAPLVGVFYIASSPGAPPYVEVGKQVEPDTTVGLVETMKVFTAIRAGKRGIVKEIFASNGQVIQSGDPLVAIEEN